MTVFLMILGIVLFVGLVVLHELGHFIMARRNGVDIEEFGIGFPPRAKTLAKKNGTVYTLNWLPLGGFVRLKGEHDADNAKGSYGAASLPAKVKIMVAGVVVNLVTAVVLLTILALAGVPVLINKDNLGEQQFTVASDERVVTKQVLINYIESGSPAEKAGLQPLDRIETISAVSAAERPTQDTANFRKEISSLAGQQVTVHYLREGQPRQTNLQLRTQAEVDASLKTAQPKGTLGVGLADYQINRYTWSAPVVAVGLTGQMTKLTFEGLGRALSGLGSLIAGLITANDVARQDGQIRATEQVSGPVGIVYILQASAENGLTMVLFIIAIISLTLAIMNVLPIPALDGGRLFVTLLYRAIRKPLTPIIEERINFAGFMALMLLLVLITIVDVDRFM